MASKSVVAAGEATSSYVAETDGEEHQQLDWAWGLPSLAVGNISVRLTVPEFAFFRSACKPWASVLHNQRQFLPRAPQFPWIMVPTNDTPLDSPTRHFLSLPDLRSHRFTAPQIVGKYVISSDKGWLVLSDNQWNLSLFQPITGAHLLLPSATTIRDFVPVRQPASGAIVEFMVRLNRLPHYYTPEQVHFRFIRKVCLSSSPSGGGADCIVALLYSLENVAFARPGDSMWTCIWRKNYVSDIFFEDSRTLLVLHLYSGVEKFHFDNASSTMPQTTFLVNSMSNRSFNETTYIANCGGDLFAVFRKKYRKLDPKGNQTSKMSVPQKVFVAKVEDCSSPEPCQVENAGFSLSFELCPKRWYKAKDLNGYSLFLGSSNSICLAPKDVPGLKGNCIYFADDSGYFLPKNQQTTGEVVVFDLDKGSCEFCYPPGNYLTYPPPIWFIPSFE